MSTVVKVLRSRNRNSKAKARRANKTKPMRKLPAVKPILDTIEMVGKPVWNGLRSIFGKEQAQMHTFPTQSTFATPSSFAVLQNNVSQSAPDEPITHSSLGAHGIRCRVQQPYVDFIQPYINDLVTPQENTYLSYYNSVVPYDAMIPPLGSGLKNAFAFALNPMLFGGAIAQKAALYDRYVFRELTFEYTTATTTTQLGSICMGIENDIANLSATDFSGLRMVNPSVTFPARIPQSCLNYKYDGDQLYYVSSEAPTIPGALAQERQQIQGVFEAAWNGPVPRATDADFFENRLGTLIVYMVVDFFYPIPPPILTAQNQALLSALKSELVRRQRPTTSTRVALHSAAILADAKLLADSLQSMAITEEEILKNPPKITTLNS